MDVLKFSDDSPGRKPTRGTLSPETSELARARALETRAVYLVRNGDIGRLAKLDGIVDRGEKDPRKRLADKMLGHERIPIIRGSQRTVPMLKKSLGKLLDKAREMGDRNVYVVGVDDELFKEVWRAAAPSPAPASNGSPEHSPLEMLGSFKPVEVPRELENEFVGTSIASRRVRQLIMLAATSSKAVLILGDSGTGKDVVARCIHKYSQREPFVTVSCAAISSGDFGRTLFGAEASGPGGQPHVGAWQMAGDGVLFLDEIGSVRLEHQASVLHALEHHEIHPVGARRSYVVPARVLASTNRELYSLVCSGQFREDLYYQLRAFTIFLPPLRERPEDIPELAQRFWAEATFDAAAVLPPELLAALKTHSWPGNARELRAVIQTLHELFGVDRLRVEHLRAVLYGLGQVPPEGPLSDGAGTLQRISALRHLRQVDEVLRACLMTLGPVVGSKRTSREKLAEAHSTLHFRLHELELLCMTPLLFGSEATFQMVNGLRGNLAYFHGLLGTDGKAALRYWRKEVAAHVGPVQAAMGKEQERVTRTV